MDARFSRHSRKSGVLLRIRARFAAQRFPLLRERCSGICGIFFAVFLAGCGGGVSVLPEPFTRERADGKIPVKVELIRAQVRRELDGTPEGEAAVARWQVIETDYNECRLSSARATKSEAEEVFAACMSRRGYVYMLPIDAEQFHNDIAFELEKERDNRLAAERKAEEERIAAEKKAAEEAERKAKGEQYNGALLAAAGVGNLELVRKWLSAGANPNAESNWGETALILAANNGHAEIAELLLSDGANLHATIDCGTDIILLGIFDLCKCLGGICVNSATALYLAAKEGHSEVVEMLLSAGANPNAANDVGETALINAAIYGHSEVVKLLLSAGANPYAAGGSSGRTALMSAALNGNGYVEIVKMLLSAGANVDAESNEGWTALMFAAYKGHSEVGKILLSAGANVHAAVDSSDWTVLMLAAGQGHAEVVKMLLSAGANPNDVADDNGETALSLAVRLSVLFEDAEDAEGAAEVIRILEAAGAKE